MNNKHIAWRRKKLKGLRDEILSGQLNAVRELLPVETIRQICYDVHYSFRKRLLPPETTIFHMLNTGMCGDISFQGAWQRSGQSGRSGSLCEARKRLPYRIWQRLHQQVLEQVETEQNGNPTWRGHRMIGVDGTGLSMSDHPALLQYFGRAKGPHQFSKFPVARVVFTFNLQTLMTLDCAMGHAHAGEKTLFSAPMKKLKKGDVLVFDRYFSGANLYVKYQRQNLEFIGRIHQCLKVERLNVVEHLGEGDILVRMNTQKKFRDHDPTMPKSIIVRIIRSYTKNDGQRKCIWVATSLLDAQRYPAHEIRDWYKKRWKVETLIREIKQGLGAAILRSQSVEGVFKELQARVVALNLIHWLILKAAQVSGTSFEKLSVTAAFRLTTAYSLKMSTAPFWQLPKLYRQLLERIATSTLYQRPNRIEPRLIKRDSYRYPRLRMPRHQWRLWHLPDA